MARSAALRPSLASDTEVGPALACPTPSEAAARDALLAEIRKWEGEPMAVPPLALRLVMAWGVLVLVGAAAGLVWFLLPLLVGTSL